MYLQQVELGSVLLVDISQLLAVCSHHPLQAELYHLLHPQQTKLVINEDLLYLSATGRRNSYCRTGSTKRESGGAAYQKSTAVAFKVLCRQAVLNDLLALEVNGHSQRLALVLVKWACGCLQHLQEGGWRYMTLTWATH